MVNQKGIPCIRVIEMKRTEYITYRTDSMTKQALMTIANEKKWSISQLTEEIVRDWLAQNRPELIPDEG